jgi:hypothetical protein
MTYLNIPMKHILVFMIIEIIINGLNYYLHAQSIHVYVVLNVFSIMFFIFYPDHIIDGTKPNKKDQWIA